MQLNIDFNINRIHYLELDKSELEKKIERLKLSVRAYKGHKTRRNKK